jgi:hypothetical protein
MLGRHVIAQLLMRTHLIVLLTPIRQALSPGGQIPVGMATEDFMI